MECSNLHYAGEVSSLIFPHQGSQFCLPWIPGFTGSGIASSRGFTDLVLVLHFCAFHFLFSFSSFVCVRVYIFNSFPFLLNLKHIWYFVNPPSLSLWNDCSLLWLNYEWDLSVACIVMCNWTLTALSCDIFTSKIA